MEVGRDKLEVDRFFSEVLLEGSGGFIIQALEFWL